MSSILCRNCGSGNPPGSRFCNQCASPLPPGTHIICPNCRQHNPLNLIFCDHCGAKLIKDTLIPKTISTPEPETPAPPKAFNLPSRAAGDTGELHIKTPRVQDWLKSPEQPTPPTSVEPTPPPPPSPTLATSVTQATAAPETDPALDDFAQWLQELQTEDSPTVIEQPPTPESPVSALPDLDDWIEEESAEDYLPDWLREAAPRGTGLLSPLPPRQTGTLLPPASPAAKDAEPKLPQTSDLPDWLSKLAPPNTGALGKTPPIDDALIDSLTSEINVPDWLKEMDPPPSRSISRPLSRKSKPLPPLPQETQPPLPAPDAEASTPSKPEMFDWLAEFTTPAQPITGQEMGTDEPPTSHLPDWLEEVDLSTSDKAATPELPDWLTDFAATKEEPVLDAPSELPDWLVEAEMPAQPPSPPPAEESLSSLTPPADWLDQLSSLPAEEVSNQQPFPLPADSTLPDWLTEDSEETPATVQATIESELPDWLADSETSETTADELDWLSQFPTPILKAEDQILAEHTAAGEFPEWLAASQPLAEEQPAGLEFSEETIAADLPDWLTQVTTENQLLTPEKPAESTVPDWLQELSALVPTETTAQPAEPPTSTELPDWLAQMMPADLSQAEDFPQPSPAEKPAVPELSDIPPDLVGSDLPDWLRDSFVVPASSPVASAPPAKSSPELPEWLRVGADKTTKPTVETPVGSDEWSDILGDAPKGELGIKLPPATPVVKEQPTLATADIPDWLKPYKPRELRTESESAIPEEPVQTSGPLAGIRGVIEIDPIIAQPREAAGGLPQLKLTPTQQQQVKLLRHLTEHTPSPIAATDTPPVTALHPLVRLILVLLVLATLIVGLYSSDLPSAWFTPPPVPATALATYTTLEQLTGVPVLVSFDYTPAMAGELNLQATLLLQQLAENGNPVLAVSQTPAGTLLAEQLLADTPNLTYTNLGWLPGEAIGLNQLAICLQEGTICANGDDIGVYGQPPRLILLFTSEQDALAHWVEQVGQSTALPMIAGLTQSLAPVAYPYYLNGQLQGMIEGLPALAAYERELQQSGNQNTLLLNAQTFVVWLVVLLLIVGNVWTWVMGKMPRQTVGKPKPSPSKPNDIS